MEQTEAEGCFDWYAIQTLSNMEQKVKKYLDKFIEIEGLQDYIKEVLMPTENVQEVRKGKKTQRVRKLYPNYIFLRMRLFDEEGRLINKPWFFVRNVQGVIDFIGGEYPVKLKPAEIAQIQEQVKAAEGKVVPKVQFAEGEEVKILEGPFMNLTGTIDALDNERGKMQVSVSIFGRLTPVELEFWQVERVLES
ncbi:MAG: transcription termination/antitermination factor NusG [Opitutales bacterium]|nr:transcription termination/antitermination factor NusG [Opitutales bacterium]